MPNITSPLPGSKLNTYPYFDDFDVNKEFYQILFKGGYSPQPRELTQLQTILQEQIGRLGNGIYKNGSSVTGAQVNISRGSQGDDQVATLTPGIIFFNHRLISVDNQSDTNGKYTICLKDGRNNFEVSVENQLSLNLANSDVELFLSNASSFPTNGIVRINSEFISYTGVDLINNKLTGLTRGVYNTLVNSHLSGSIVYVVPQRSGKKSDTTEHMFTYNGYGIEDYIENPSTDTEYLTWFNSSNFQLGIKIIETIIDSNIDESLLGNELGIKNYNEPGADRLKITLKLDFRPLNQEYSDFIYLLKYKNGAIIEQKIEPQFSEEVNSYLSRQVDEISGNFTINPHNVTLLEWNNKELQANTNRQDTFALNISSGKAYVSGYRRETLVPTKLIIDKGYNDISSNFSGSGITVKSYDSFVVTMSSLGPIPLNKIMSITTNYGGVVNHYAWVRQVDRVSTTIFRVFFSDASAGFYTNFTNGVAVSFYNSEDPLVLGSVVSTGNATSAMEFTDEKTFIYNSMPDSVNYHDLTLYTRSYQTSTIPSGTITSTLDNVLAGEISPSNSNDYKVVGNPGNELYVITDNGTVYSSGFTISTSGTNQISWVNPAPTQNYRVYYKAYSYGTDTMSTETTQLRNTQLIVNMTTPTSTPTKNVDQFIGGVTTPTYYDVWKINQVVDLNGVIYRNGVDYILIDNQTPNYFYGSFIRWFKNRNRPTGSYSIDFNYWYHYGPTTTSANGSFITADSFTNSTGLEKDYLNISKYDGRRRSDFIDFRTRNNKASIVDDTMVLGDNSQNTVDVRKRTRRSLNNTTWAFDVQRYLPRWDTLFLNKQGEFILLRGTPRLSPEKPKEPDHTLLLANIYIPAYARSTGDAKITSFDSVRYTQADIKNIENRVSNLEIFMLNNALEKLALEQKLDDNSIRKGIMVDDFSGHGIADVNNPEYTCAIDPIEGALRLPFIHEFVDLSFDLSNITSIGSNMVIHDKTITLGFDKTVYIENTMASTTRNVNPFDTFEWIGNVKLEPSVDIWVDTGRQPDIIKDDKLKNSHFAKETLVTGWEREFNFWYRTPFGLDKNQIKTDAFQSKPTTISDTQINGGINIIDRPDYVENELRNSSIASTLKITGIQNDLT